MSKCIYCGNNATLTKEHVFPDFLNRDIFPHGNLSFIGGVDKYVIAQPVIKDVCSKCNNGVLSQLDAYGKTLTNQYFKHLVIGDIIHFKYDYDLFLRWLLKVTFNASRAYKISYRAFKDYVPFILGESALYPTTAVIAGIWKPSVYQQEILYPNDIAFSQVRVADEPHTGLVLTCMFTVRSYSFTLLGWEGASSEINRNRIIRKILRDFGAILLSKEIGEITINPAFSKLEHLSRRLDHLMMHPTAQDQAEKFKAKLPQLRVHPIDVADLPASKYLTGRTALITVVEDSLPCAILALSHLPAQIALAPKNYQSVEKVPEIKELVALVTHIGSKTYIRIPDPYNLGEPLFYDEMGVSQSEANWVLWRDALQKRGYLIISTAPKEFDPNSLVVRIRALINEVGDG
jgi:hypothetical protein